MKMIVGVGTPDAPPLGHFAPSQITFGDMEIYRSFPEACTKRSGRGAARRGALGRNFRQFLQHFMYGIFTSFFFCKRSGSGRFL